MLIKHINKIWVIELKNKTHTTIYKDSLSMRIILIVLILLFFNGCVQNTALLGPIYTLGTTGNVVQAGLSYGTSYVVKKTTGKTPSENINTLLKKKKTNTELKKSEKSTETKESPEVFFRIVKKHIKESIEVNTFINQ